MPTSSPKPTSAYPRRIWFLYEELCGRRLELAEVTQGNYVDLLDERCRKIIEAIGS